MDLRISNNLRAISELDTNKNPTESTAPTSQELTLKPAHAHTLSNEFQGILPYTEVKKL